jgi:hypothetical protein
VNDILSFQFGLMGLLSLALLAFKVWVFVDALVRRPDAYVAADKQTKPMWALILGLSAAAELLFPGPIGLLSILGTVASIVYLVDARPALAQVTRPRR